MPISLGRQGDVVLFNGVLNRDTVNSANQQLLPLLDGCKNSTLDLAEVSTVDTAALAWLVNVIKHHHHDKHSIVIQNVPEALLKVAKICNVEAILPLQ